MGKLFAKNKRRQQSDSHHPNNSRNKKFVPRKEVEITTSDEEEVSKLESSNPSTTSTVEIVFDFRNSKRLVKCIQEIDEFRNFGQDHCIEMLKDKLILTILSHVKELMSSEFDEELFDKFFSFLNRRLTFRSINNTSQFYIVKNDVAISDVDPADFLFFECLEDIIQSKKWAQNGLDGIVNEPVQCILINNSGGRSCEFESAFMVVYAKEKIGERFSFKMLLCQVDNSMWSFPGGKKMCPSETFENCIAREVSEELYGFSISSLESSIKSGPLFSFGGSAIYVHEVEWSKTDEITSQLIKNYELLKNNNQLMDFNSENLSKTIKATSSEEYLEDLLEILKTFKFIEEIIDYQFITTNDLNNNKKDQSFNLNDSTRSTPNNNTSTTTPPNNNNTIVSASPSARLYNNESQHDDSFDSVSALTSTTTPSRLASPTGIVSPIIGPITDSTTPNNDLKRRISLALNKDSPSAASHILLTERGTSMLHLSSQHHPRHNSISSLMDSMPNEQNLNDTTNTITSALNESIDPQNSDIYFDSESDEEEEVTTPRTKRDSLTSTTATKHAMKLITTNINLDHIQEQQDDSPSSLHIPPFRKSVKLNGDLAINLHQIIPRPTPGTPMSARSLASMLDQFIEPTVLSAIIPNSEAERRMSLDETVYNNETTTTTTTTTATNTTPKIHGSAYIISEPTSSNNTETTTTTTTTVKQPVRHKRTVSVDSNSEKTGEVPKKAPPLVKSVTKPKFLNLVSSIIDNEVPIYKSLKFTDEEGKEFRYVGTVLPTTNELHGRGELLYPNKTVYEGDFDRGKKHGFGKMIFPSPVPKKPDTIAIGQWTNDVPSGEIPWKISYDGEEMEYWGYVKLKTKSIGKTILTLDDFERTQEGELYFSATNTKYFGSFKHNQKYGFGVEIYPSIGERYCGGWKHDMYHYLGTYHYKDGTYFQGMYKKGQRKGKGKLYLPNGDILEGFWYGDSKVESCTYYKGTCKNVHLTNLHMLESQIQESIKLYENMGHMDELAMSMYDPECVKPASDLKWTQYIVMYKEDWRKERHALAKKFMSKSSSKLELLGSSNPRKQFDMVRNNFTAIVGQLLTGTFSDISSSTSDPSFKFISNFISFFVSIFCGTYYFANNSSSAKASIRKYQATLIYHAIDDIKSFIMFLSDKIIWDFFMRDVFSPALGSSAGSTSDNQNEQLLIEIEKEFYPLCKNLTSNIIHEKLFSTVFELYNYHYRDRDLLMNQRIRSLQSSTTEMFGIPPEYAPLPPYDMNPLFYEGNFSDIPYEQTIKILDQIKHAKSVVAKIDTLANVRASTIKTIKKYRRAHKRREAYINYTSTNEVFDLDKLQNLSKEAWWTPELERKCEDFQVGADDVTTVYSYIFCKCNLDNFTATFNYVNDWKSEQVNFDPVSHIIRFFEGFLLWVEDIDLMHNGQFISKSALSNSLESAIEAQVLRFKDKNLPFFWLPSLLVHVGLEIGKSVASSAAAITNMTKTNTNSAGSLMSLLASFNPVTLKNEQTQEKATNNYNYNPFTKKLIIPMNFEVLDISNQSLTQSLVKYVDLVQSTLSASTVGFNIELKKENNETLIIVNFEKVYPSYVYSEIALSVTKFIKYEIQNIIII